MHQSIRFGIAFWGGAVFSFGVVAVFTWGIPNKFGGLFGNVMLGAMYLLIPCAISTAGFAVASVIDGSRRALNREESDHPAPWCPDIALNLIGTLAGGLFVVLGQLWLVYDWNERALGIEFFAMAACFLGFLSFAVSRVIARRWECRGARAS